MRKATFKVFSGARKFNGRNSATVTINRATNLVTVRPHRMHKTYELRLEDLAERIIWTCVKAELREKKAAKKLRRGR